MEIGFLSLVCLLSHGKHLEQLLSGVTWPDDISHVLPNAKVHSAAEARGFYLSEKHDNTLQGSDFIHTRWVFCLLMSVFLVQERLQRALPPPLL